ncbi:MAG: GGDEF domain-containing protein [Gammaproteobacteria bacterium]|nr:MAG: GGDEF domain-containing protein [Gammaproteobacteria bacterium]
MNLATQKSGFGALQLVSGSPSLGGEWSATIKSLATVVAGSFTLLVLTWFVLPYVQTLPVLLIKLFDYLPFVLLLSGMALCWRFGRTRLFLLMVWLAALHISIHSLPGEVNVQQRTIAYVLMAVLSPVNVVLIVLFKERGIFTKYGFMCLGLAALQIAMVAGLAVSQATMITVIVNARFDATGILSYLLVPQVAQLLFIASTVFLLVRLVRHPTVVDGAALASLAAILLTLQSVGMGVAGSLYVTAASIILLLAVVQDSYNMAYHDELTGLPGRRALNEDILKLGGCYVIAMVDVDHFKKFNDKYGHDVGDQVLRFIAARLGAVRGGGKAYRYGGEEFTLLFPNKTLSGVADFIVPLHEAIANSRFQIRSRRRPRKAPKHRPRRSSSSREVAITVSIGLAERDERYTNTERVLKAADKALYKAKRAGRNCLYSRTGGAYPA